MEKSEVNVITWKQKYARISDSFSSQIDGEGRNR